MGLGKLLERGKFLNANNINFVFFKNNGKIFYGGRRRQITDVLEAVGVKRINADRFFRRQIVDIKTDDTLHMPPPQKDAGYRKPDIAVAPDCPEKNEKKIQQQQPGVYQPKKRKWPETNRANVGRQVRQKRKQDQDEIGPPQYVLHRSLFTGIKQKFFFCF